MELFLFLAAIASDPSALPLWLVVAFAAGMYPIGLMFQCTPCCNVSCTTCTEGQLPDTVTVTFSGFTDKSPGPNLATLSFSSCYGSGAAGRVTAPSGEIEDAGPIEAVTLSNKGGGYAKLGREAPTLTATGGGSGATITVNLSQEQDECKVDYWQIKSIDASGGTGYQDGEYLTITAAEGDTTEQMAGARINTVRSEPTLTLSVPTGADAELTPSLAYSAGPPEVWSLDSVTVVDGGTGYYDGQAVDIAIAEGDVQSQQASASIRTTRLEPTVEATAYSYGEGAGAVLAVTLSAATDYDGRDVWAVASIAVTEGGEGYTVGDPVYATVTDGTESGYSWFEAYVDEVDESGGVLAVAVYAGGEYYKDGGVIESVVVGDGGEYYHDNGVAANVTIDYAGRYYRENAALPPYVAAVTVTINQTWPSEGAAGEISAVVEDDTSSPDFGKIASLAIDAAGDGYLAWRYESNDCCGHYFNDVPIVLARFPLSNRGTPPPGFTLAESYTFSGPNGSTAVNRNCVFVHRVCGSWGVQQHENGYPGPGWSLFQQGDRRRVTDIAVGFVGEGQHAIAQVYAVNSVDSGPIDNACAAFFSSDGPIETCGDFEWTGAAASPSQATISVVPGGDYDPTWRFPQGDTMPAGVRNGGCGICCQGSDLPPPEIEVQFDHIELINGRDLSGTYIVPASNQYGDDSARWWGEYNIGDPPEVWWNTPGALTIDLRLVPGHCASRQRSNPEEVYGLLNCGQCIKECTVEMALMQLGNFTANGTAWRDGRYPEFPPSPGVDGCETCIATPVCEPPAGTTIPLYIGSQHIGTFTVQ